MASESQENYINGVLEDEEDADDDDDGHGHGNDQFSYLLLLPEKGGLWDLFGYAVLGDIDNGAQFLKNAKFAVTGHSLGGALASLFTSVLVLHGEMNVMQRLLGVYTFAQQRIRDCQLGRYVEAHLVNPVPKYFRVVYCNDFLPRLPYDERNCFYKHFGVCLYYDSLYIEQKMEEEEGPNRNYFGMRHLMAEILNAAWELMRSLTMGYIYIWARLCRRVALHFGKDSRSTCVSSHDGTFTFRLHQLGKTWEGEHHSSVLFLRDSQMMLDYHSQVDAPVLGKVCCSL